MHGKGAVDGVGGAAKRAVWRAIKARSSTVKNAQSFCEVLGDQPSLQAFHVDAFCREPWVNALCKDVVDNSPEV
jgi:hypothetical protein